MNERITVTIKELVALANEGKLIEYNGRYKAFWNNKTKKEYLDDLLFYNLHNGRKSYENAALMYIKCRKSGITVRSTIDLIIAQIAIENQLYLLHDDVDHIQYIESYKRTKTHLKIIIEPDQN
jgi:predicted nucleic acid-binding protein